MNCHGLGAETSPTRAEFDATMAAMKWLGLIVVTLFLTAGSARAGNVHVLRTPPSADGSFPFWCDWGYDWDERCYRDDTARLPVGGVADKVWRGAVRFSLDVLPGGARVTSARLGLYFDGACVALRRKAGPCAKVEYTVDAYAVLSPSWTKEREVDFDPVATASTTVSTAAAHWSSWT